MQMKRMVGTMQLVASRAQMGGHRSSARQCSIEGREGYRKFANALLVNLAVGIRQLHFALAIAADSVPGKIHNMTRIYVARRENGRKRLPHLKCIGILSSAVVCAA